MALTQKQRDALPASDFAVPAKRALPIHDAEHVRLAWDRVDRTEGLSDSERAEARRRILRRAAELGVETGEWRKTAAIQLSSMAIALPATPDHPNKHPFSGVMTRVDEPSDLPTGGSLGKRVVLTRAAVEAAIPTLLGMAVDFTPGLDGHDPRRKIGIITEAQVEGTALSIKGFFYAADFPVEVRYLRANTAGMGFSYEILPIAIADPEADPMVVTELVFTGAAVLWKTKGAYHTTSLAANAAEGIEMTKEELQAAIGEAIGGAIKPVADQVKTLAADIETIKAGALQASSVAKVVEPHAKALHAAADAMCAAGIGNHATAGHGVLLHRMADSMMAEAHQGVMPSVYRDHDWPYRASGDRPAETPELKKLADQVAALTAAATKKDDEIASLGTKVKDLEARGALAAAAPERKTLSPAITALMARGGIQLPEAEGGKIPMAKIDEVLGKGSYSPREQMQFKIELRNAGLLE